MSETPDKVCDILGDLQALGERRDRVSIGDVVGEFGHRSYGPFLFVPALMGISPLGAIPGVPTFLAVVVALLAVQIVIGRDHLWLPSVIEDRSVSGEKLANAAQKLSGAGKFMDRWFRNRLSFLTAEPVPRIAAAIVVILCCGIPPLEVIPLAVAAPMAVILAFGLALLARDGVLMLVALGGSGAAAWLAASLLLGGSGGS